MINIVRRHLLVSTTALFSLTLAPALVSALSAPLGASIVSVALADDDNGGGNDDNDGNDGNDGNDDSGNDDNGNDDDNNGTDDDASGTDDNGVDDDATDDSIDDNGVDDDLDTNGVDDDSVDGSDDRTSLVVNNAQLRGLKNGTMVAIDQNGRRLALEIDQEHNRTEVKIKAPRNSVTAVTIVPAN